VKEKFDMIIQGPGYSYTEYMLYRYRELNFIGDIIFSSYSGSINFRIPDFVRFVDNPIISPAGQGNRNLQIQTSRNGLSHATSKLAIKIRSDIWIRGGDLELMRDYWIGKNSPVGIIYTLGMYRFFPYHPRDHVFWGYTSDLQQLFDIPFDVWRPKETGFRSPGSVDDLRFHPPAETYIGQFFYAKKNPAVREHIDNPALYLGSSSPRRSEALALDYLIRDSVFRPFPRINCYWAKHDLAEWPFEISAGLSEYWACDDFV